MENIFYVYEWFNTDTNEVFYVGKGCRDRFKETKQRNQLFQQYYNSHKCDVRIIKQNLTENDALKLENETILNYKNNDQCFCNLDNGGKGGLSFVWTDAMRQYKSNFNPMKSSEQRKRMSEQNPMYNKNSVEKMKQSSYKIIHYLNRDWTSQEIVDTFHVCITTAQRWAKRGYDTQGNPCYYKGENQFKPKKTTCSKGILLNNQYFPSLRAACDFLGVKDTSPLCRALKAGKSYKGYKCEYANQQPSDMNSNNSSIEGSTTNE